MNNYEIDSASEVDAPGQPVMTELCKGMPPDGPKTERRRRESAVIDDETAVRGRENVAATREDAAHVREDAVYLREGVAASREREICAAEATQEASDDHMLMLQQANAHLVVATIEAQKLTEQVEMAKVQLEHAKLEAEQANLAKSNFLSSMSHELRTPLNAILGFAQLLEAGSPPPTPAQNARIQQIVKSGWYLLDLINEILDLAVIESGKLSLSPEPVLLVDVMRECQAMIEPQAQQHGIQLDFRSFDPTWMAYADRTRVKQVLVNLLTNAIKYNREHGTVSVTCTAPSAERIRISIKDSGAGLSPEKLAQLFQPFNRLGQEAGTEEGTGIGLVVTKQLIELMGGTIGVESTVSVGCEFWIELIRDMTPRFSAAIKIPAEPVSQAQESPSPGGALRTLLYVEDNPANLMLVEHIMKGRPNIRMLSARDGHEGIALARAHLPDVILMDINLPGIGGIDALKILRADAATAHIPVLALSANAMPADIEKGLRAGFFRYLTKPIKIDAFMLALDTALERAKAGSGSALPGSPEA